MILLRFLFCCFAAGAALVQGAIVPAWSLSECQDEMDSLNKESLVLFDVDYTLVTFSDALLRPGAEKLLTRLFTEIGKIDRFQRSAILLQAQALLIEEDSPHQIRALQKRGVPVIAFTALWAGPFGYIASLADWRIEELRSFSFDFTLTAPAAGELLLSKSEEKEDYPIYKEGVLFSSTHSKGEVLVEFLDRIAWKPQKVLLIDDRIDNLQRVEEELDKRGIPFIGFHYMGAKNLPFHLDEALAEFQWRHLLEEGRWLSDEEARSLLGLCPKP